ncbi:phage tail protein, partial [Morganella morganii]
MTVSTELSHEEYTGNGVTTDFDFRFRIFEAKHLVVSVAQPDGIERILTNGTDYTLRGVGSYRGGKVILKMPLATGWKIGIARDLPVVQETDLRNQGKFFAEVHEDAFDYLTMLIQKSLGFLSLCLRKPSFISDHYDAKGNKISNLGKPVKDDDAVDLGTMKERISAKDKRSLRVADKDIPVLPNVANRANKLLSFDNDGNPVVIVPESGSAADVLIELGSPEFGRGDSLIAVKFPSVGAISRTQHDKNTDIITSADFGIIPAAGVDMTEEMQKAFNHVTSTGQVITILPGEYLISTVELGKAVNVYAVGAVFKLTPEGTGFHAHGITDSFRWVGGEIVGTGGFDDGRHQTGITVSTNQGDAAKNVLIRDVAV